MTPESGGTAVTLPAPNRCGPAHFVSRASSRRRDSIDGRCSSTRPVCPIGTISASTTVFADEASAIADAEKRPEEDAAAIAYLKEQQWTNPFATASVREGDVRTSIRVPAAIEPVTGGEALSSRHRPLDVTRPTLCRRSATGRGRTDRSAGSNPLADGGEDRATLCVAAWPKRRRHRGGDRRN